MKSLKKVKVLTTEELDTLKGGKSQTGIVVVDVIVQ